MADANFIHSDHITSLLQHQIIGSDDVQRFAPILSFQVANRGIIALQYMVHLHVTIPEGRSAVVLFLVSDLIPREALFIGHQYMQRLGFSVDYLCAPLSTAQVQGRFSASQILFGDGYVDELLSTESSTPSWLCSTTLSSDEFGAGYANVQVIDSEVPTKKRLMVRFRELEQAVVDPVRQPNHKMSQNKRRYVAVKLCRMAERGEIEECRMDEVDLIESPILVDKRPKDPPFSKATDDEIDDRYRLVLDAKLFNTLVCAIDVDGKVRFLPPERIAPNSKAKILKPKQFQSSGFEGITQIPRKAFVWFAKVDIKDGFNNVRIPPPMRRLYGCRIFDDVKNRYCTYRWMTCVQGSKISGMAFGNAVNYINEMLYKDPRLTVHIDAQTIAFSRLVDDIIPAGATKELCQLAIDTLLEHLSYYSLAANPKKIIGPTQDLEFCGFSVTPEGVKPHPTRRAISDNFAAEALVNLRSNLKHREKIITWFKSIAGTFQYFRGFLTGDQFLAIQNFYDLCTKLERDPIATLSEADMLIAATAVNDLTEYIVNSCPRLYVSNTALSTRASILLVDGNVDSWTGMLLHLIEIPAPAETPGLAESDMMQPLIAKMREDPNFDMPTHFLILPCYISGGVWTSNIDRLRSSTMRERVAQLYAFDESKAFAVAHLFAVGDNDNSTIDVDDPALQFGGATLPLFLQFNSEVKSKIWLPRSELPSIPDMIARLFHKHAIQDKPRFCPILMPDDVDTSLASDFINGYTTDTISVDGRVRVANIYAALKDSNVSPALVANRVPLKYAIGEDGLLYRLGNHAPRVVVPHCRSHAIIPQFGNIPVRNGLLYQAHVNFGRHDGQYRMRQKLEQRWWWPGMSDDIAAFCNSCHACCKQKGTVVNNVGVLSSIATKALNMFDIWVVDYCGPFTMSDGLKKYVLLFIDCKSRWLVATVMNTMESQEYVLALQRDIVAPFGRPKILHSDQGSALDAVNIKYYAQVNNIILSYGFTNHSRSQGLVENAVRELKTSLALILEHFKVPQAFDASVATHVHHHNHTPLSRTGVSPFNYVYCQVYTPAMNRHFAPMFEEEPMTTNFRQIHDEKYLEWIEEEATKYDDKGRKRKNVLEAGQEVYRVYMRSQHKTVTGPHILLRPLGSNSWALTPTSEYPSNTVEIEAPETQLHPVVRADILRVGLPDQLLPQPPLA